MKRRWTRTLIVFIILKSIIYFTLLPTTSPPVIQTGVPTSSGILLNTKLTIYASNLNHWILHFQHWPQPTNEQQKQKKNFLTCWKVEHKFSITFLSLSLSIYKSISGKEKNCYWFVLFMSLNKTSLTSLCFHC